MVIVFIIGIMHPQSAITSTLQFILFFCWPFTSYRFTSRCRCITFIAKIRSPVLIRFQYILAGRVVWIAGKILLHLPVVGTHFLFPVHRVCRVIRLMYLLVHDHTKRNCVPKRKSGNLQKKKITKSHLAGENNLILRIEKSFTISC